jgi:hypothetical protein
LCRQLPAESEDRERGYNLHCGILRWVVQHGNGRRGYLAGKVIVHSVNYAVSTLKFLSTL